MKNILVINASARAGAHKLFNEEEKIIKIPRNNYTLEVSSYSSCDKIESHLLDRMHFDNISLCSANLRNIKSCIACYNCVEFNKCCLNKEDGYDPMGRILPSLEKCNHLVIISPLYYGTVPADLLAFFSRLYIYWIKSVDLDPKTGFPNNYPKFPVTTIGTCADPWQKWDIFDATLKSIYNEIGWEMNGEIHHFPNYKDNEEEKDKISEISKTILNKL